MGKVAVVRIRGENNLNSDIKDTLKMLRLYRKHYCVVLDDTDSVRGMLKKVKDYVAYGNLTEDTFNILVSKRGELYKGPVEDKKGKIKYNRFINVDNKKFKKYFRLSPPKGGFERRGIKVGFGECGVLGDRKDKINDLIKKMV